MLRVGAVATAASTRRGASSLVHSRSIYAAARLGPQRSAATIHRGVANALAGAWSDASSNSRWRDPTPPPPRFARAFSHHQLRVDEDEQAPRVEMPVNKVAVVGGGNMAEAFITSVLADKLVPSRKLAVSDPNPDMRQKYEPHAVFTTKSNAEAVKGADVVLLAVKPQVLQEAMASIKDSLSPGALVISIVAGVTIHTIQEGLGHDVHVVRTMPNTPAMVGEGMTVWAASPEVTDEQHELTCTMLGALGIQVFVEDEKALDMATAISGTGPAYFFLVAEAMIDAGVHMGFSRRIASTLVRQTMLGTALYMNSSTLHPVILRNNITSPGGTTSAALYRAEKNGFRSVIADSIWAAYERCLELGSPVPIARKRPRS